MFRQPMASRLEVWRKFRYSLNEVSPEEAIQKTVNFWHSAPFLPHYLDPDDINLWPNPWQLIEENYYCDLAKALGMLYTLYLTDHKNSFEYELRRYQDEESGFIYNLVVLDQGKYVLNLVDNEIVNNTSIDKKLKLLRCWSSELNLQQY